MFSIDASQSHRFNDSVQERGSIVKCIESVNSSSRQDNNDPTSFSVKINSKKIKKVGSVVSSADSNQNAELSIQMDYALKRKLVDKRREL